MNIERKGNKTLIFQGASFFGTESQNRRKSQEQKKFRENRQGYSNSYKAFA